jgi:hypothetical protein
LGKRGVRVAEGLEIGDKLSGFIAILKITFGLNNLIFNRKALMYRGPCAGTLAVTEDTSVFGYGSVPIRATQSRIQGYLLNPFPEYFP